MKALEIVKPGFHTTIQDRGRFGSLQFGIPPSGAVDSYAYCIANLLVGNRPGEAALEATVLGPVLHVLADAIIAITGADLAPRLNDAAIPLWESVAVKRGDRLSFGPLRGGCRSYVAIGGGIDVPLVLGSRSTYAAGRMGGKDGRPLRAGDILERGDSPGTPGRRLPLSLIPRYTGAAAIRVVLGPQDDHFSHEAIRTFLGAEFRVSTRADRMGYRLEGPIIAHRDHTERGIISEPGVPGGIQVPADGQPIILLTEQTVGGYAKIATVISIDVGRVGQAKPGDRITFRDVSVAHAHRLLGEEKRTLARLANVFPPCSY